MKALSILLLMILIISGAAKSQNQDDERIAAALEKISKTTSEGREVLSKVQRMKPELNECKSTKALIELVEDFSTNKGGYNIFPIGWFAEKKKTIGRWKIVFYYKDYAKTYHAAEWEYNPETAKLYAFEFNNAPTFWTEVGRKKSCLSR